MAVHEEPGTNRPREAADTTAPAAAGGGTPAEPQERTAEEMEDRWRRCMADLDNQRKRHARELKREREAERGRVAGAWLPVIDHLELALSHARSDPSAVVAGVQAVRDQAVQVLAALSRKQE